MHSPGQPVRCISWSQLGGPFVPHLSQHVPLVARLQRELGKIFQAGNGASLGSMRGAQGFGEERTLCEVF